MAFFLMDHGGQFEIALRPSQQQRLHLPER